MVQSSGEEGGVKGGTERGRRSGRERVGRVTIIDSFVAGFLCVGAGELSASCTRHDWTRQTGLTWKHIVCTWRVLPMWTTVPIIVCCLCTDNSAFSEAWQLKLHTRNTCGPAGKWLESRHQMISRWLWKPWYVVCSLRIGIYSGASNQYWIQYWSVLLQLCMISMCLVLLHVGVETACFLLLFSLPSLPPPPTSFMRPCHSCNYSGRAGMMLRWLHFAVNLTSGNISQTLSSMNYSYQRWRRLTLRYVLHLYTVPPPGHSLSWTC